MKVIDRELSWLDFNYRVIHQATRKSVPLLERIKFLGIGFNNLNEFTAVRFSSVIEGMLNPAEVEDDLRNSDFNRKYRKLLPALNKFKNNAYDIYKELMKELRKVGVTVIDAVSDMTGSDKKFCRDYFDEYILPVLYPTTYDTDSDIPLLSDKEVHMFVRVSDSKRKNVLCFVTIPERLPRLVRISDKRFVLIEEIVKNNISKLFVDKKVEDIIEFKTYKFISDADFDTDEGEFVTERMRSYLEKRDFTNHNVALDIRTNGKKLDDFTKVLYKLLDVPKQHVYNTNKPVGLSCLCSTFYSDPALEYKPFKPHMSAEFVGDEGVIKHLDREDILIQHPYESFDLVIDFIKGASRDRDVISIKQTLYRVSSEDSPIINALCDASRRGKKVVVLLEVKARFDERQNLFLVDKLRDAGCTVICGMSSLKVHCKMLLVTKMTSKGLKIYSHVGTGNYNDKTAKIYTDISYLTSSQKIGRELNSIFNMISGFSNPNDKVENVYFSPYGIRKAVIKLIDREVKNVAKGKPGYVIIKANAICDYKIIKHIYSAARKGVKFKLIVRGICSIVANENIKIKSIVGRFLEHSRIYYFANDGNPEMYVSSADLMTRNLDKRVELMTPVKTSLCKKKLMNILKVFAVDSYNGYSMDKEGDFKFMDGDVNSHEIFIRNACNQYKYKVPKKVGKNQKW